MTIISTGNNFGYAGQIGFNAFLSENLIVLNGRFSVDTTTEEYRSAETLEVCLPQLPMAKSAVSNAYIRASVMLNPGTAYERTESIGTVVGAWITGGDTLRIEKLTEYDGNGSFEILLCSMFTTRGYRGEVANLTQTAVKFTVLSDVSAKANDLMCITTEGWSFIHLYFNTSSSFFSREIRVQLEGFPENASADVFLVGGGQQTMYRGAHISEGRIGNGILTVPEPAASMSDTGENSFLYAFIVRGSANAEGSEVTSTYDASEVTSTAEGSGGVSTDNEEAVRDLDNQQK